MLFGGYLGGPNDGETWEWDGMTWSFRADSGPSQRRWHALAYDSARAVTVLFGGYDSGADDGETWEWDGAAWSLRTTTGPTPRYGHSMAYDSARGVTVLFGGEDSSGLNDQTWEWNGAVWNLRATDGPSPRFFHTLAYDSARGVTVLFGGDTGFPGEENGETWEWDGATWMLRADTGPPPRQQHAMAYDSVRGVTVLFGGSDLLVPLGDTWEWECTDTCLGEERLKKAACKDRNGSNQLKVILTGGAEGDTFTITVTDGATKSGTIDARGKGKATFKNRPAGDAGTATSQWGCGASDQKDYACP